MKKIILTCASAMILGLMVSNAQTTDTTKRSQSQYGTETEKRTNDREYGSQGATPGTPNPGYQSGQPGGTSGQLGNQSETSAWRKDMLNIQSSEVPSSIRKTLNDPMYAGWENSNINRNKSQDEYVVEVLSGSTTKVYRFDKNGKPLTDNNIDDNKQ